MYLWLTLSSQVFRYETFNNPELACIPAAMTFNGTIIEPHTMIETGQKQHPCYAVFQGQLNHGHQTKQEKHVIQETGMEAKDIQWPIKKTSLHLHFSFHLEFRWHSCVCDLLVLSVQPAPLEKFHPLMPVVLASLIGKYSCRKVSIDSFQINVSDIQTHFIQRAE